MDYTYIPCNPSRENTRKIRDGAKEGKKSVKIERKNSIYLSKADLVKISWSSAKLILQWYQITFNDIDKKIRDLLILHYVMDKYEWARFVNVSTTFINELVEELDLLFIQS